MDFPSHTVAILGVIAFVLLYNLLRLRKQNQNVNGTLPPVAAGSWPIIGHLHLFGGRKTLARTLSAMADEHGPIFSIWMGKRRTVVISSYEAMKTCFTTNDKFLSSRPQSSQGKYLGYDHTIFPFAPYGNLWRDVRKLTIVELLSSHKVKLLKPVQSSEVSLSVKDIYKEWKINENGSVKINMSEWLEHVSLNIISKIVVGRRIFDSTVGHTNHGNDEEGRPIAKIIQEFLALLGATVPSDIIPYLGWLDYKGRIKSMKDAAKTMDSILDKWIEEHESRRLKSDAKIDQDFIDVMLDKIEDDSTFSFSREMIIKGNVLTLISGGSDTTALGLTWILTNLLNNRHTLERAQEELDLKVGRDRCVEDSDIENLVYIPAIVKESLRLCPSGPLGLPREATDDCVVDGYLIPKGTQIFLNYWKLHRDPKLWPNPEEFRPERFLTTHEDVDTTGHNFELLPFGSGRRVCPGIHFANQMMHMTLARLLQAFYLTTPSNEPVDTTEAVNIALVKATPLEIMFSPRLAPELY